MLFGAGIVQGIVLGIILALVTSGMTLIYRVTGIINFAHGSLLAVGMYLAYDLQRYWAVDPLVSSLAIAPLMALTGWALFQGLIRPIRRQHHLLAVQILLGLSFIIEAVLLMRYGADMRSAGNVFSGRFVTTLGVGIELTRIVAFVISLLGLSALGIALKRSDWGRRLRATAADELAAYLVGISVIRVEAWTWGIGVGILGLVGPVLADVFKMTPDMGLRYTIVALVVVIIGGGRTMAGTVIGGLVVGVSETLGLLYLPGSYGGLMPYALLAAVLLVNPRAMLAMVRGR
ncbi:MAG: branched-chain amino acid ABC transporter permease [Gemmatimonadales bacterium]